MVQRLIAKFSDAVISGQVVCDGGVYVVNGYIHGGYRDAAVLMYRAAEPCDLRMSIQGSGLPFAGPLMAFGDTNSGVAKLDSSGGFEFKILSPNSYYKNDDINKGVGQGKILIEPILYLTVTLANKTQKMYEVDLGPGMYLRSLTNHPTKPVRSEGRNTASYFYWDDGMDWKFLIGYILIDQMSNGEIFIYLGKSQSTHFFLHYIGGGGDVMSSDAMYRMCGQIYNAMIHNQQIMKDDKMVIYNLSADEKILPVLVDHVSFIHMDYPLDRLKHMLNRLITVERKIGDPIMIIKSMVVNGEAGASACYEVPLTSDLVGCFEEYKRKKIGDTEIALEPLVRFLSNKPITYL